MIYEIIKSNLKWAHILNQVNWKIYPSSITVIWREQTAIALIVTSLYWMVCLLEVSHRFWFSGLHPGVMSFCVAKAPWAKGPLLSVDGSPHHSHNCQHGIIILRAGLCRSSHTRYSKYFTTARICKLKMTQARHKRQNQRILTG